jgi:hypothetical protein
LSGKFPDRLFIMTVLTPQFRRLQTVATQKLFAANMTLYCRMSFFKPFFFVIGELQ